MLRPSSDVFLSPRADKMPTESKAKASEIRSKEAAVSSRSAHIQNIIDKHNRTCNLQIVFVDIEKYSLRRSAMQIAVIDSFTRCLREALKDIAKKYIDYSQAQNINFDTDILKLPTGDGAAIAFSFEGLSDIHLEFAKALLRRASEGNKANACEKFLTEDWCDCHSNFNLRISLSEAKGIIFEDLNGLYNVAGSVINDAQRILGQIDRNQIAVTEAAYRQIVDLSADPDLPIEICII